MVELAVVVTLIREESEPLGEGDRENAADAEFVGEVLDDTVSVCVKRGVSDT